MTPTHAPPAPPRPAPDELTPEQRQRAAYDAQVAMVHAAADRRTITALTLDGRTITGTLVWWPSPDRTTRCNERRAKIQLPSGAWLPIVTRPDTIELIDQEPAQ